MDRITLKSLFCTILVSGMFLTLQIIASRRVYNHINVLNLTQQTVGSGLLFYLMIWCSNRYEHKKIMTASLFVLDLVCSCAVVGIVVGKPKPENYMVTPFLASVWLLAKIQSPLTSGFFSLSVFFLYLYYRTHY